MQYAVFRLGVDPVRQSNSTQFTFLLWKNFDSFIHTHTNTRTHTSWSIARDISNRPSIFCLWQTKQKKISGIPLVDGESTTTPPTNLSSINNRICGSWKLAEGLATKYMNKVYVAQPIVESIEIYCGGILLGSYIYMWLVCIGGGNGAYSEKLTARIAGGGCQSATKGEDGHAAIVVVVASPQQYTWKNTCSWKMRAHQS